jgi:hypothetical protein
MSHISKIDTKIQNMDYLKKALHALGMEYIQAENGHKLTVCGYGKNEDINGCLMEIKTGSKYGIGIRQTVEGKYEIVADWWAIETFTGQKQDQILNKLTRQYAYETVMDKVKNMGYSVVQENEDSKQNVRITVRRWK